MTGQRSDKAESKLLKRQLLRRDMHVLQNLYSAVRSRPAPPSTYTKQTIFPSDLSGDVAAKWMWRCHIDVSKPQRHVWNFLEPYIERYDAAIFSMPEFEQRLGNQCARASLYDCLSKIAQRGFRSHGYGSHVEEEAGRCSGIRETLTQPKRFGLPVSIRPPR